MYDNNLRTNGFHDYLYMVFSKNVEIFEVTKNNQNKI